MIIFWRLLLASLINDYFIECKNWRFLKKMPFLPDTTHVILFVLLCLGMTVGYWGMVWFDYFGLRMTGIPTVIIFGCVHAILDNLFERDVLHFKKLGRLFHAVMHRFFTLLIIFVISPDIDLNTGFNFFPEGWVIVAIAFIVVYKTAGKLIDIYESDMYDWEACPIVQENYITNLQRIIFFLLCLVPGYSPFLMVPAWFALVVYARKERVVDISGFNMYFGSAFAVTVGVITRIIIL